MSYTKTTMADAIQFLRKRTGNYEFYSDDELQCYINEGIRVWHLFTGYWRGAYDLFSVSGQIFYSVNLLKTIRVEVDGVPIEKDSTFNLDFGKPAWQSDAPGTPKRWFPVGLDKIGLNPAPVSGMTIRTIGIDVAPVCSFKEDYINASEDVIGAILDYAQHIASFKSGGEDFKQSLSLFYKFIEFAGIQNSKFKETSIYRDSFGRDLDGMMHPQWKKDGNNRSRRSK